MHIFRFFIGLLLITISLLACSEKAPFSDDKMAAVIADMRIAKSASDMFPTLKRDSIGQMLVKKVYEIHQIDKSDYDKMILYLSEEPELYTEIEKKVMDIIIAKQGEVSDPKSIDGNEYD